MTLVFCTYRVPDHSGFVSIHVMTCGYTSSHFILSKVLQKNWAIPKEAPSGFWNDAAARCLLATGQKSGSLVERAPKSRRLTT